MENLKVIRNYPLSTLTTLAIGGPAKEFVEVTTEEELIEAIKYAKQNGLEYMILGGGSNLLVADQGVEKLIIKNSIIGIQKDMDPRLRGDDKEEGKDKTILTVKSGTSLQHLVDYSIERGLSGLQKLAGIPGTVGGAIYGNAGAYGQSISDHLVEVTYIDDRLWNVEDSTLNIVKQTITKEQCGFDYRFSNFKKNGYIILKAKFELKPGDTKTLTKEAANTITQREVKYPPGIKCPGSFFKNIVASTLTQEVLTKIPPDKIVYGKLPAGVLLEEVGAKGVKLGKIEIASYHANLFLNKGGGSAKDFYDLAKEYAHKVKEKYGITLEPEVQLVNLPPV